jgi:hypothetical protein
MLAFEGFKFTYSNNLHNGAGAKCMYTGLTNNCSLTENNNPLPAISQYLYLRKQYSRARAAGERAIKRAWTPMLSETEDKISHRLAEVLISGT